MPKGRAPVWALAIVFWLSNGDGVRGSEVPLLPPVSWEVLAEINADIDRPHEAVPAGVPVDFDWARKPRLGESNDPGSFSAITGWGQIFHVEGDAGDGGQVEIRSLQVFACHGTERSWVLLQDGGIEGNQFRADFQFNVNEAPRNFRQRDGVATVGFGPNTAYHFWPRQGRVSLPGKDICGIVVLLQARSVAAPVRIESVSTGRFLVGAGADYWIDRFTPWDGDKSNRDVAIGRLKLVTPQWQWFGLSTASLPDLVRFYQNGYRHGDRTGNERGN